MPGSQLLDLKTDLKSLKFGHDRPSGGDSGEPFVQVDVSTGIITTTTDKGTTRLVIAGELAPLSNLLFNPTSPVGIGTISNVADELINTDSFIRGGLAGYRQASINQNFRIGGFLSSIPKGRAFLLNRSLFLVDKATGLTASGVPLAPNQLLNTAIQRGKTAIGLSQSNINYRRVLGASDKYFSDSESRRSNDISAFSTVLGFSLNKPKQIDQYPKNVRAKLNRSGFTNFLNNLFAPQNSPQNRRYSQAIRAALAEQTGSKSDYNYGIYGNTGGTNKLIADNQGTLLTGSAADGTIFVPNSQNKPTYTNRGTTLTIDKAWNQAYRDKRVGSGLQDEINLTPLLDKEIGDNTITRNNGEEIVDLVNFRIYAINSDNPTLSKLMVFRAYINEFSDSTDATWNEIRYAGRGEPFFIYNGFSRTINIGFKVAALSSAEMNPMYKKLNFLMGNVMPDYGDNGEGPFMKGPFVRMTVGNWIYQQEGILRNVSYTVPNDSPWEVGLPSTSVTRLSAETTTTSKYPLVLPHIVDVKMTFIPIGSSTDGVNKISGKSTIITHIGQEDTSLIPLPRLSSINPALLGGFDPLNLNLGF